MTDVALIRTIAAELREMLSSGGLQALYGEKFEDITVYEHDLPLVQDEDDEDLRNYIVVMCGDEESDDEEWNVEIHFSVNIEDRDRERSGNVNVLNLMNEIYMHFTKKGIIDGYAKMETKAYKFLNMEAPYPYYEGDLITNWKLPLPLEEGLEDFI
ncbi:MAG: hypothetical protein K1W06_11325 [Lachnospiraceae bacterium]